MLNVMGSFISTELDAFENLHKELEEKGKEIERLNKRINKLEDRLQRIRNNECEKLSMKAAILGIPSSQLLDKSQKLKGEDEK